MKQKLNQSTIDLGKYYGYELIGVHKAGESESLVIYSYLIKYEFQPIRFQFVFYKPLDKQMIYNFQFDFDINDDLIKSSKLYFLNATFEKSGQK